MLREETHQPSILYPEVKEKYFLKQKYSNFFFFVFANRPALQELLKVLQRELKHIFSSETQIYINKGGALEKGISEGKVKTFNFFLKIYFIAYAVTVVPVFPLFLPPPNTPIPSSNPPILVHVHGSCIRILWPLHFLYCS